MAVLSQSTGHLVPVSFRNARGNGQRVLLPQSARFLSDFLFHPVPALPEIPDQLEPGFSVAAFHDANLVGVSIAGDSDRVLALAQLLGFETGGQWIISNRPSEPAVGFLVEHQLQSELLARVPQRGQIFDVNSDVDQM